MIRGIHYFSAEVKPKLMSSQGAALINSKLLSLVFHSIIILLLKNTTLSYKIILVFKTTYFCTFETRYFYDKTSFDLSKSI